MRIIGRDPATESVPGFADEIAQSSGQPIEACYQCGKCTAGCPTAPAMDLKPNQVIRAVQLGMKDLLLDANGPWYCVACETCASRCPRHIDMARVNKAVARRCLSEGHKPKDPAVAAFHRSFIESMSRWGRAHEVEIMSLTKLRAPSQRFTDLPLGAALFARGKLALLPHWVRQSKEVRAILARDTLALEARSEPEAAEETAHGGH